VRSVDELLKALSDQRVFERVVLTIARAGERLELAIAPLVR